MPDFRTIYENYRKSNVPFSLDDYAKLGNAYTGTNDFAPAQGSQLIKKGSYWIDKTLEATTLPKMVGEGVSGLLEWREQIKSKVVEWGNRSLAGW